MTIDQKMSENNAVLCPTCGSSENSPLLSKTTFSLKGRGWYKDGYQK